MAAGSGGGYGNRWAATWAAGAAAAAWAWVAATVTRGASRWNPMAATKDNRRRWRNARHSGDSRAASSDKCLGSRSRCRHKQPTAPAGFQFAGLNRVNRS